MTTIAEEYEFTPEENRVFDTCGERARLWGILCLVAGALQLFGGLLSMAGTVQGPLAYFFFPQAIVNFILGGCFVGAARAFKNVATTEGSDVTFLIQGLDQLSKAFRVQIFVTIASAALVVIGIVSLLVTFGKLMV